MKEIELGKIYGQVCSDELSKKLKELGVKQESLWYWAKVQGKIEITTQSELYKSRGGILLYSAFTVAELGKMLPQWISDKEFYLTCLKTEDNYWWVGYMDKNGECQNILDKAGTAHTEADARAKMLVYLLENKLLKVEDLKCLAGKENKEI